MTGDFLPLTSSGYWFMLALLLLARGMDFFSTWVATPNLLLEGNPLAKKMGWKTGGAVNIIVCVIFAFWPLTAIIIATSGVLVAAHNFRSAWLMRSMGEEAYREWYAEQLSHTRISFYFGCLLAETALTGLVGAALVCCTGVESIPFAIGLGILAYAVIVLFYTSLSLWRLRRRLE